MKSEPALMTHTLPQPIEELCRNIQRAFPAARVSVDPPMLEAGIWFIDVLHEGQFAVVQWKEKKGFGLSCSEEYYLGEGCHEVYSDLHEVNNRIVEMFLTKGSTTGAVSGREAAQNIHRNG